MDLGGDDDAYEPPSRLRAPGFARKQLEQQQQRGGGGGGGGGGALVSRYAQQPAAARRAEQHADDGEPAGDGAEAQKLQHARELVLRHRREERERERRREAQQAQQSEGFEDELAALEAIRAQKLAQAEDEKRMVRGRGQAHGGALAARRPRARARDRGRSPAAVTARGADNDLN